MERVLYLLPQKDGGDGRWRRGTLQNGENVSADSNDAGVAATAKTLWRSLWSGISRKSSPLYVHEAPKVKLSQGSVVRESHLMQAPPLTSVRAPVDAPNGLWNGQEPAWGTKFRAFTPLYAFMLNSLITALAVATGFEVRHSVDVEWRTGWIIVFGVTFGCALGFYTLFYSKWGFGGGMIAPMPLLVIEKNAAKELFGVDVDPPRTEFVITRHNACIMPSPSFATGAVVHVTTGIRPNNSSIQSLVM